MTKAWLQTALADGTSILGDAWVRKVPGELKELEEWHRRVWTVTLQWALRPGLRPRHWSNRSIMSPKLRTAG